jgi:phosphoribosyl 1,2-cyclic phosphate phosphodiesterase
MELTFLGTGAAWGLPEVACDCMICREMRVRQERRTRTSLLLKDRHTLLIDCGPDAREQLARHAVSGVDAVFISHEHNDHYIGLDELFAFLRNRPTGEFEPIPVFLTGPACNVVRQRFAYLEDMQVIESVIIDPKIWFRVNEFEAFPFQTDHGSFAKGSVGFLVKITESAGRTTSLVYTSDFKDIPGMPEELVEPDYLIIQSFWLNEPVENRPSHMSFQRALRFIGAIKPRKGVFLVHMGDADMIPGDPANNTKKKYEPLDSLKSPLNGKPYPIPMNQAQWQETVNRVVADRNLPYSVTVAYDGLTVSI